MGDKSIIRILLEDKLISDKIKEILMKEESEVSTYTLSSERFIDLYQLRLESISDDKDYKDIKIGLERILNFLKINDDKVINIANVINRDVYLTIYSNEENTKVIEMLDFTGLGNTKKFM